MKTMFLEQSYQDVNKYLADNINSQKYEHWDYIVITASNDSQAKSYELQIEDKLNNSFLDKRTTYLVVPDLDNERIGSGGATLNVLVQLKKKFKVDFNKIKVLLIHSGGDSKRIPQYSACGKLFSPVPRELNVSKGATLFDELIASTALLPSRMNSGVLVMSGDAVLLFNPLQVELKGNHITAVSIKENVKIGKNHGVFNADCNGHLIEFLHKKSVSELTAKFAVDSKNKVNIDTGMIYFDGSIANKMLSLVKSNDEIQSSLIEKYINSKIRLSFYGDFLYPFAMNSSYNNYLNEPAEGTYCDELIECRKAIWDLFSDNNMNVICVSPAEFLHFGTTSEMLSLMTNGVENYKFLGWGKSIASSIGNARCASYNSVISCSKVSEHSYIENSIVTNCDVASGSIVSNLSIDSKHIPSNIVLSGLLLSNGKYVARIYGSQDNPKLEIVNNCIFGNSLADFAKKNGIDISTLSKDGSLWTAKIYPVADTMAQAVSYALKVYNMIGQGGNSFVSEWKKLEKVSLESSYNNADINWIVDWDKSIKHDIIKNKIIQSLENNCNIEALIALIGKDLINIYKEELLSSINNYSSKIRLRLYMLAIKLEVDNAKINNYNGKIFSIISEEAQVTSLPQCTGKLLKDVVVSLPARVNFAGGWTDTPPYCNEMGGTVLNASILVNGVKPICASIERLDSREIILASSDMRVEKIITNRDEVLDCSNPFDRVVLPKAALVAMGIVSSDDDLDLTSVFDRLGGGIKLTTNVVNIPKGSGLGTSSILAGACIKAIYESLCIAYTAQDISNRVMRIEQIMSTGGGWQDQIGGVVDGIKLITSRKGNQVLDIRNIELEESVKAELNARLALIYTGQRRLARNLLREIVFNFLSGNPATLNALDKIENIAMEMTRKLERGDIDAMARLMNDHWLFSKQIDSGTTNTCIDYIFQVCDDLLASKMICGAGGGGFLQVLLKKGVSKQDLNARLAEVFTDSAIVVYDCEVVY